MRAFQRGFRKQNAVVGDDADRVSVNTGESADQCRAIKSLELVEVRCIDDPGDDFADVVGNATIRRYDPVELGRIVKRRLRRLRQQCRRLGASQMPQGTARDAERIRIVHGHMIRDPGGAAMDVGATELLRTHFFPGGCLHQRRAGQKYGALAAHDDALVGHGRDVGAARGARSHDHGDLGDALGRHVRLIVENTAEVLAIRKHLILIGQIGAAGVHQVDAGQAIRLCDLLGAQMLLHRDGIVSAALHGGVVGDDHTLASGHPADAGDNPRCRHLVVVHAICGELGKFHKRRARIQ